MGYSPQGHKESDTTERLTLPFFFLSLYIHTYTYILEKEMATHSSILAWEIPWKEGAWRAHGLLRLQKSWT